MGRGKGIIKNTLAPIVKNSIIFMFKKIRRNTLFILRSKLQFKLGIQLGCIYDIFKTEESCGASSISKIHINF